MKRLFTIVSSTRTMALLLLIFGVSIGTATFIERDYGPDAARSVIYNALWFNILLSAGMVNIIAVTLKKRMYQRSKLTILLFHLAFVIIILGAGITRFFGTEGSMEIREGETSGTFLTSSAYISISLEAEGDSMVYDKPVLFSDLARNRFRKSFTLKNHHVSTKLLRFYGKAGMSLQQDIEGTPHAIFVTAGQNGMENRAIRPGGTFLLDSFRVKFMEQPENLPQQNEISLFVNKSGSLSFISPVPVIRTSMTSGTSDTLSAGEVHPFQPLTPHYFMGKPLVLRQFMEHGRVATTLVEDKKSQLPSALVMDVNVDGKEQTMTVFGMKGVAGTPEIARINGASVSVSYGSVQRKLPFEVHLNDFILKRYPGSGSPSWFESNVRLIDRAAALDQQQRIFMNNILNYKGYRLYQASYDTDEHGTVLSVNHDGWGTRITYFGYLCMAVGFLMSLVNRNSRFAWLWRSAAGGSNAARIVFAGLVFGSLASSSYSQDSLPSADPHSADYDSSAVSRYAPPVVSRALAVEFDTVLVQDNGGRIEPMSTLASEILRKVVRKETYEGQTPGQIVLGMLAFPRYWLNEPMILVNHPEIQRQLGISGRYASFADFFRGDQYVLKTEVEEAYRKKPAYRTKYDNELIRTDERLNICNLIYTETSFKIFPVPGDSTNTWYSPVTARGMFVANDSIFALHVLDYLALETQKSASDGDWELPVQLVRSIKKFQENYGGEILPSVSHIRAEIFYNRSNLFVHVMNVYMLVGFVLLIIQFFHLFYPFFNLRIFNIPAFIIILIAFLLHASGLGMRWYISGHAPWSNGYEALTFIAWATVLAGLIFSRKSGITLSATAILASLILMVAHMSWMDPQITNLVPVLKSYWLVIHVAVITASYGFLGLGALLAAVNLFVMIFQTEKNTSRIAPNIEQITRIIEMTLTVGLYMLATGTFLGGVWANESWGRYWGWDPKETWALTTVIVYAVILHLRIVPGLKDKVLFNILALAGFSSVVMTYFGVNYYLSGLHSYAKGDPMPVPPVVYYSLALMISLSLFAALNQARLKKSRQKTG